MTDSETHTLSRTAVASEAPWNVLVHDDPVNLMAYVTYVLMKVFGYDRNKATVLMIEVHKKGRSIVWSGQLERAEFYVQQLQAHQLKSSFEKAL